MSGFPQTLESNEFKERYFAVSFVYFMFSQRFTGITLLRFVSIAIPLDPA